MGLRSLLSGTPAAPAPSGEYARRHASFLAETARLKAEIAQAEREAAAAQARVAALASEAGTIASDWTTWRDAYEAQAWASRGPHVDALIKSVKAEAAALQVDRIELWTDQSLKGAEHVLAYNPRATGALINEGTADLSPMARVISNSTSVVARRKALMDLVVTIEDWVRRGADEQDLRAKFAAAHRALPEVASLRSVLKTDVRGKHLGPIPGLDPQPAA